MTVFNKIYSDSYDYLYSDHNYAEDVECIMKYADNPMSIIDFGCGTGKHLERLYREIPHAKLIGVDQSSSMLAIAKDRCPNIKFIHSTITEYKSSMSYDISLMMSGVLGYHLTNNEILEVFRNIHNTTVTNGLFIFDVWNGSSVLDIKPSIRIKETKELTRIVSPVIDTDNNLCTCNYTIFTNNIKTTESHTVRYFFKPELELMLNMCNFEIIDFIKMGWHMRFITKAKY